jgi:SpoVK/Ycf46/Vps4 family AAA+-type ATPase
MLLPFLAMMKAQFMSLWDGFSSNSGDAVIIIGATNRPADVDTAILRRMPTRFFIQMPNEDARAKILKV